jgi:hypothetical protein
MCRIDPEGRPDRFDRFLVEDVPFRWESKRESSLWPTTRRFWMCYEKLSIPS